MPLPADQQAVADELIALWREGQDRIQQELARALTDPNRISQVARLRALATTAHQVRTQLETASRTWLSTRLPLVHAAGGASAATAVGSRFAWSMPHLEAIHALAQNTWTDVAANLRGLEASTVTAVRQLTRDAARETLIEGATAAQAGRDLEAWMGRRGIAAVTYANGSRHLAGDYADTLARTVTANAYNTGTFTQARVDGHDWVEVFDGPACVMPGQGFVAYGNLVGLVRARFSGSAYRITARTPAGPDVLTVGPHHPILTVAGWKPAHALCEGDELVYDVRVQDPLALAELDLEQVPLLEDLQAALAERGPVAVAAAAAEDLHGDGRFCEGEVEVVGPEWRLLVVGDPALVEHPGQLHLVRPDARSEAGTGDSGGATAFLADGDPAYGFVGGPEQPITLGFVSTGPLRGGRTADGTELASPAPAEGPGGERASAGEARRRWRLRHLMHAFSGAEASDGVVPGVEGLAAPFADGGAGVAASGGLPHGLVLAVVESIEVAPYAGWVYDATTSGGMFLCNGFVVKNCGWTSHDDPDKANGTVRHIDDAENHPISHPRCARSFAPRPDVTSQAEADAAAAYSGTEQAVMAAEENLRAAAAPTTLSGRARGAGRMARTSRTTRATRVARGTAPATTAEAAAAAKAPVSAAANISARSPVKGYVDDALAAIDSVHTDGTLPQTTVNGDMRGTRYLGFYSSSEDLVAVSSTGPWPRLTAAHEFGHMLDYKGIPGAGATSLGASATDNPMHGWWTAITSTEAYKQLLDVAPLLPPRARAYVLNPKELWARSYAQFIATEAGDATLGAELDAMLAHQVNAKRRLIPLQWQPDDFTVVAEAIQALIVDLGWAL